MLVDGAVVGQTQSKTELALRDAAAAGTHSWQVRATDIRGQATRSKTRVLRDRRPQAAAERRLPAQEAGRRRSACARATTRAAAGWRPAWQGVRVSWGDGTPPASAQFDIRATHRYPRGRFTLTITARDKAGNEVVDERRLRIGV